MKLLRQAMTGFLLMGVLGSVPPALAADDLFLNGDAKCTACHDEGDGPDLLLMGKTKHGTNADKRTPTCTNCHGSSETHLKGAGKGDTSPLPDITYGRKGKTSPDARNGACLSCHQKDAKRMLWMGSQHQARDVSCSSCHQVHSGKDKVRDKRTQPDVCYTCHKEQRAQANRPSHHPVPEGKMGCSDCHNVHGSAGPKLMKRDSVVDTCYTCHMEKRGPFVHNHEPVNDDCTICHNPHGTTAESMLKVRPPFLCQQCHTPHVPSQALLYGQAPTPNNIGWNGASVTQGRACLNCHTQIHGSNNPSATNPTPQFLFR
ncbi:MAG: DmsE family decaheme c-type cytochrome [Proteobacteria bacterium]|nr:DmsE family decaheme c-type cytochrome [Pseudomonadota bacterium]